MTFNLAHFPRQALEPYGLEALHPDEFVADLIDLSWRRLLIILLEMTLEKQRPPMRAQDVIASLRNVGLHRSAGLFTALLVGGD